MPWSFFAASAPPRAAGCRLTRRTGQLTITTCSAGASTPSGEVAQPGEDVGTLVEKWRFPKADSKETIGVVHATPAVVDGEVYFGTGSFPAFYKLDANGKLKWVYRNPARKQVLPPTSDGELGDKLGSTIK